MGLLRFEKNLSDTKIIVGVGGGVRIDLQLQAGGQAESVTVTEAAPLVDTSPSQRSSYSPSHITDSLQTIVSPQMMV